MPIVTNAIETGKISDGYHTFDELYEHRAVLYLALARFCAEECVNVPVWRAKSHSDGMTYAGWFVLGIWKNLGGQITYHLPLAKWDDADFAETLDRAPEWDGHTPTDVLERLKRL